MVLTRVMQLGLLAIPVLVMGWLLNQWFVPTGVFHASHQVGENSPFIDNLKPETRVMEVGETVTGEAVQAITADPAFFFVHPHRDFFESDRKSVV